MLDARAINITIGKFNIDYVHEVEVISTWENFTDTCKITFPRKLNWFGSESSYSKLITNGKNSLFKRGDYVEVNLGYDGILKNRFTGQLVRIHTKDPLEFECEDKMYLLKQTVTKKYFFKPVAGSTFKLKKLLSDILPIDPQTVKQVPFTCVDLDLSDFKIERATIAETLDYLKKSFGLSSFFQDGILSVGFAYNPSQAALQRRSKFSFTENIIDNDLDYIRDGDIAVKVRAVSITSSRSPVSKIEREYGDSNGETRTLYFYNVPESQLASLANEQLSKLTYEGFRGSFTTFLEPLVKHGDAIDIIDPIIPDRSGTYLVRKVVTKFGVEIGGRQIITLDRKL